MFTTLLIANRGEIACRIAATARRMGIRTVAVYSDADADARHVAACDSAVHIGGPEPRSSYLRADAILEAARQTGAQAIHPGYGFLSENEDFARACAQAGIVFVGPPADAIAAMGSKSAAKRIMEKADVPLVPGYHGDNQEAGFLKKQADAIGYPVLIKASAGGGGKGMRIVESADGFNDALASCKREAASSFGDDKVLIERYLTRPRHIEIQVFADGKGQCVYLFERDCSVQRRHQKVIEEAPAPGMTVERRRSMGEAAVAAARAVDYVGAGTVEFIAEPDGRFYFMEMNTRLQVEHPVTEMITGQDLVEWQLRVAAGEPLPAAQDALRIDGHAMEARIYAENPDNGFLPSIGTLAALDFPPHVQFVNGDVRVDGGVRAGDTITPYYDPMIAKLIVHGSDRDQACARLAQALGQLRTAGVQTNVAFLRRLVLDQAFAQADLDTGLIERRHDALFPPRRNASAGELTLALAALMARLGRPDSDPAGLAAPADPWDVVDGWRVTKSWACTFTLLDGDAAHALTLHRENGSWTLSTGADQPLPLAWRAQPDGPGRYLVRARLDGMDARAPVLVREDSVHVFTPDGARVLRLHDAVAHASDEGDDHGGSLAAPMPGKIIAIQVKAGDTVKAGDALLVMEAMKMEHTICAPSDGTVEEIFFAVGDQVVDGAELVALTP
ncbi:acetyl/propionyl/methylcrotonyl-CoA carboxylase subunit alpha [Allopusillimonas soli]|uniref:Acetyl/propionyl/methylcrotonyl-CoA carboxylase subunit alpha n=1 Tax=Allopusillimonas soli TaxID=659016 RepID=A0A853FAY2_9BURK|nr:acetyl/propionyl/methylcrotonyl-CoA carboxylase subunit alpha [Allopusillimonas soli]NYT37895.1 acetyl/propionyl/methylcrotonyl-CoA carboxylase subunit alpha [Allopusillimonas soli]TEA73797.1 acetyl/propionyl/methylcrotonyl-CoA carboxylase subunit alpha [Allopusillimonas soli]